MGNYRLCWKFEQPSWKNGKKKPVRHEGSMDGGIHPYTNKEETQSLADEMNRIYGAGTHWIEEIPE